MWRKLAAQPRRNGSLAQHGIGRMPSRARISGRASLLFLKGAVPFGALCLQVIETCAVVTESIDESKLEEPVSRLRIHVIESIERTRQNGTTPGTTGRRTARPAR